MTEQSPWFGEFCKHAVLLLGAVIVLLPFYLMISYSFKSPVEIETNTGGMFGAQEYMTDRRCIKEGNPAEACKMRPIVYNYTAAFKEAPLLRYLMNGVVVTISIFFIQVIVALPCAYALAKLRFWGAMSSSAGHFLPADPGSCDCFAVVHHACKSGLDQHLCRAGDPVDHIGFWYFPDAPVLQDRAGRSYRCGAHGWHERIFDRLASYAAHSDPCPSGVWYLLSCRSLE